MNVKSYYSRFKRETLALIFEIRKYHKYLYGIEVTVWTDSIPVHLIFGETITFYGTSEVLRWARILSGYAYKIVYTNQENVTDCPSRLPMPAAKNDLEEP